MAYRSKGPRTILPFGLDYSDVFSTNYDLEKPRLILPVNAPLTAREKSEALQCINMSRLVLDGPFFTGNSLDETQKTTALTLEDGIERHSDKYKRVKKIGTTIEDFPLNIDYFPHELYGIMGVSNKKRKKMGLSTYKSAQIDDDSDLKPDNKINGEDNKDDSAAAILQNLEALAEDYESKPEENQKEEDQDDDDDAGEDPDDYDDDEDDDYNAEKYFDDGDEEYGDNDDDEAAF